MTLNRKRRIFLKASLATGLTGSAFAIGLLTPRVVVAAWDQKTFASKTVDDALKNGLGSSDASMSDSIVIEAPEVAANGATVPVTAEVKLSGVESIALLSENNARPLCLIFRPGQGVRPNVTLRIKMGKTGNVIAVAKSGGKLYMARRKVTVTVGGCA